MSAVVTGWRRKLWANRYRPIAVTSPDGSVSGGKRPAGIAWQDRARQTPPAAAVREAQPDALNTGILADGLRAVDVDFDDAVTAGEILDLAARLLGEAPIRHRANSGKFLALYRAAEGAPGKRTLAAASGKIEVLGAGQQFVAYGRHPSGADLEWTQGSPLTVPLADLPAVTEEQVTAFFDAARTIVGPATARESGAGAVSPAGLTGDLGDVAAAVREIPNDSPADWNHWIEIGMAIWAATGGADDGLEIWRGWSMAHPDHDDAALEDRWQHFRTSPPTHIGAGTLMRLAKQANPDWRQPSRMLDGSEFGVLPLLPEVEPERQRRRILAPTECDALQARRYVVKGLLAERDVACLFGPPGAGKSLVSPHLGYALAQGRPFFGLRTKMGGALYVAAEDQSGMKLRVRALHEQHGDAPGFGLVEGVSNLLSTDSPDLTWLIEQIAERRPSLVVIDTLAMAFPGLEENEAAAMGRVVAVARRLTLHGAAVILVHHDSKAQDGTPRGHSLLNGALDVAIHLAPKDEDRIVRARMTKNRNGSIDHKFAFLIGVRALGRDDDGDDISAAFVLEMEGRKPDPATLPRLTPAEAAALGVLRAIEPAEDGTVNEDAWRSACETQRVATSDDPKNRRKVISRIIGNLVQKGRIDTRGGSVLLVRTANEFDSLPEDGDRPGTG